MRKLALTVIALLVTLVILVRLIRTDEQPPIEGIWRELLPPDFE